MALPKSHQSSFTPGEIEFIAGEETITIIPKVKMPKMKFVKGEIGPLLPPLPLEVPVWLALIMRKNGKCSLVCPEWLTIESLKQRHEEEEKNDVFSVLPFHYMELAQLFIETAADDIPKADQIRKLLKDIRETRQVKSRVGVNYLDSSWIELENASFMEVNELRPFFSRAFNEIRKLDHADDPPTFETHTQASNNSRGQNY